MRLLLFALLTLAPLELWAFPEMVRHNYVNCIACHVSPNGGGNLTKYGRETSRAILSTWHQKTENGNEAKFAYGIVPEKDLYDAMVMYRGVYAYQNTPFIEQGKYIYMQGDGEAAMHITKEITVDGTLGYVNEPNDHTTLDHVISRRHYVNYRPTDQLSFRFGRFYPEFGINVPDHVIATKRGLGWDEGHESYNFEAAWIGDTTNLFVTGIFGRFDKPSLNREEGFAITPSLSVADHHKIGLSYFYGDGPQTTRHVVGPWGILGFTPHFFLLSEWDVQSQSSKSGQFSGRAGFANYNRLDYEVLQGLHFYVTQDYQKLNWDDPSSLANSFGVGSQFFPRPHFEINLSWQKRRIKTVTSEYTDFAWVMLNFYL